MAEVNQFSSRMLVIVSQIVQENRQNCAIFVIIAQKLEISKIGAVHALRMPKISHLDKNQVTLKVNMEVGFAHVTVHTTIILEESEKDQHQQT